MNDPRFSEAQRQAIQEGADPEGVREPEVPALKKPSAPKRRKASKPKR